MIRIILYVLIALFSLELIAMLTVKRLRKKFQWLITPEDERPLLDREGLKKFIIHGYDPEFGWIRKPNTWHPERGKYGQTSYHIDSIGSRCNPGHEHLKPMISCFGDSFSFCRQVNDNETWQWYLAGLAQVNVLNFAVGNYGIDQAYLRMVRELKKINTDIVILGVVPSTIVRVLCVWKHYNEFGNTFGFKPRYDIKDGKLILVRNIIDSEKKFYEYEKYLEQIQKNDYFYTKKFRDEMIKFPYLFHTLKKPGRNFGIIGALILSDILHKLKIESNYIDKYPLMMIMHVNKVLRYRLFFDKYVNAILDGIVDNFVQLSKEKGFKPVFLFTPQKDDMLFIKNRGKYYEGFIERTSKKVLTIDITDNLLNVDNMDAIYSDDNRYGGHFSKEGNEFVAGVIYRQLKNNGILNARKKTYKQKQFI